MRFEALDLNFIMNKQFLNIIFSEKSYNRLTADKFGKPNKGVILRTDLVQICLRSIDYNFFSEKNVQKLFIHDKIEI